ncbi:MAG: hypothetical protein KDN22_29370 [Verrucomicrobiae bacterium]|nr:hypothetical protein [Verrucomicrobiae bacterium]
MNHAILATSYSLLFLAASSWAGEAPVTPFVDPAAEYSVTDSAGNFTTLGQPIRPCLCHGAYAGSESDEPFSFNLTTGYDSSYICRGLDVGDDVFHMTGTVDYRLSDNITWSGSALYRNVTDVDFEEFNLYTGLFFTFGDLTIGPTFRWWNLRPDGGETNAYDLGIQALYKLGQIDLTTGYYYETESEGSYFEFGVSSSIQLHERVSFVPSAQISYTDGWLMPNLNGLNYADLRVSLPIEIAKNVKITPYIGAAIMLDALEDAQDDKLIGGVALSITF